MLDFCSVIQRRARVSSELLVVVFRLGLRMPRTVCLPQRGDKYPKAPEGITWILYPTIEDQQLHSGSHWSHTGILAERLEVIEVGRGGLHGAAALLNDLDIGCRDVVNPRGPC